MTKGRKQPEHGYTSDHHHATAYSPQTTSLSVEESSMRYLYPFLPSCVMVARSVHHRPADQAPSSREPSIVMQMNRFFGTLLLLAAAAASLTPLTMRAQAVQNPILFVTQVPTPFDSANVASLFGNHVADMPGAPRGGDLWIRYPDGTLKNLTQAAGYGTTGLQGTGAIAVREPAVYWDGTRALFSMV